LTDAGEGGEYEDAEDDGCADGCPGNTRDDEFSDGFYGMGSVRGFADDDDGVVDHES